MDLDGPLVPGRLLIHDNPEERYTKIKKVGEGTYGVVYMALDKRNNNAQVALKKIRLDCYDEGIPSTATREIAILRNLSHENIVCLENIAYGNNKLVLVFEYLNEDLKMFMDTIKGHLQPHVVRSFTRQLLNGIAYCHSHRVLHRDLKPQNLLIDRVNLKLKLCDFGLSRSFTLTPAILTREVVTLWYRPPEILLGNQLYTTWADIWPSGCIFAEMLEKRPLFPGDAEIDQLFRIFRTMGTPTDEIWPGCTQMRDFKPFLGTSFRPLPYSKILTSPNSTNQAIDLLNRMLQYEPSRRISARDALTHPYFWEQ